MSYKTYKTNLECVLWDHLPFRENVQQGLVDVEVLMNTIVLDILQSGVDEFHMSSRFVLSESG